MWRMEISIVVMYVQRDVFNGDVASSVELLGENGIPCSVKNM